MNIMIINGSPKKKGGASAFFAKVLRLMLFPHKVTTISLGISKDYREIFNDLQNTDAVVITVPLYVDSIPAHFIHLLKETEQYQCWCERTGIKWGGGLGIGGGVMLHVLYKITLIWSCIQLAIGVIFNIVNGNPYINNALLSGFAQGMILMLFFYCGMLLFEFILAWAIRNKRSIKNKYTRVMLPSFIFIIVATIFMALTGLLHGKLIFPLFKKVKYTD